MLAAMAARAPSTPSPAPTAWRNRIVGYGEEAPEQLLASPWNWRIHPGHQQGRATLHAAALPFGQRCPLPAPFPSDPHYDAKAWHLCAERHRGRALFWNVLGALPENTAGVPAVPTS